MTDEAKALVEKLRDLQEPLHEWDYSAAADLIETQAREIERLREALEWYVAEDEKYIRVALARDSHD